MAAIGIDFGTTKTMVSRWDPENGCPEIIFGGGSLPVIPTAIHIDHTGQMLFGQEAVDQSEIDPDGYFDHLKRCLGDPEPQPIHSRSYSIVQLCFEFLRWLKNQVETEVIHDVVDHAIITVPAIYRRRQREDLLAAAKAAGFTAELLDEPEAAGLAFLNEVKNTPLDQNVLVVDWGGGTLDLAVLDPCEGVPLLYPDLVRGRRDLGGRDIDEVILNHVDCWPGADGLASLTRQPRERRSRILRELERCKKSFRNKEDVDIRLPLAEGVWQCPWQRADFESVILPTVKNAMAEVVALVKTARDRKVFPAQVLLVGGSSKLRLLEIMVRNQLAMEPLRWHRSLEAVALGAAVKAHGRDKRQPTGGNTSTVKAPLSIACTPPEYGVFIRIINLTSLQSMPDGIQKTHFPMGPDILITNNCDIPIKHVALKLLRPNIAPVELAVIAKLLNPDERVRLTIIDTGWYLQAGDVIEVGWHAVAHVLKYTVTASDSQPLRSELLPIGVAWIEDGASGKSLNVWNFDETRVLRDLLINTLTGHTVIPAITPGRVVRISSAWFSDSRSIRVGEPIKIVCDGYQPAIGVVAQ